MVTWRDWLPRSEPTRLFFQLLWFAQLSGVRASVNGVVLFGLCFHNLVIVHYLFKPFPTHCSTYNGGEKNMEISVVGNKRHDESSINERMIHRHGNQTGIRSGYLRPPPPSSFHVICWHKRISFQPEPPVPPPLCALYLFDKRSKPADCELKIDCEIETVLVWNIRIVSHLF